MTANGQPASISSDRELLEPIGLVVWAGIRLQHSVRDLVGAINGQLTSEPFKPTLGGAITELKNLADSLTEPSRGDITAWCDGPGRAAKNARDSVVHAIAFTAEDERQAIGRHGRHGEGRFTAEELTAIAHLIEEASRELEKASKDVHRSWR